MSPDQQEWLSYLQALDGRLLHILRQRQSQSRQQLQWLQKRLQQQHPGQRLRQQGQRLDELELRLRRTLQRQLKDATAHLRRLTRQCLIHNPQRHLLQHQRLALSGLARALDSVSPLATLERGYSITRHAHTGQVVTSAADLKPGEHLETRLRDGQVQSIVQQINLDNEP